jgi:hypothetical protein
MVVPLIRSLGQKRNCLQGLPKQGISEAKNKTKKARHQPSVRAIGARGKEELCRASNVSIR